MRKVGLAAVVVAAVFLVVVAVAAAAPTFRGIEPIQYNGNPKCSDIGLGSLKSVYFQPVVSGASAGGITVGIDGKALSWYSDGISLVRAVIVKGGNNANVYFYTSGDDFSDGGLYAPVNTKNGQLYDVGSARFCYS